MAEYLVNNTDLTAIANAIRTKGGTSAPLSFPQGFVDAVEAIEAGGGEETYRAPYSDVIYTKNHTVTLSIGGEIIAWRTNNMVAACQFAGAESLETIVISAPAAANFIMDNTKAMLFYTCSNLRTIVLDAKVTSFNGAQIFDGCIALESVQIGSIGKPFTGTAVIATHFRNLSALETITMFVDAETYEDIPANIKNNAPFGAPNANVIYKNSTTGEVISA